MIHRSTDKIIFRYRQSNVWGVLPASDYYRNQITKCSSHNKIVLCSSRKLGGAAEHLIDGSEKRRVCMLFKGAVKVIFSNKDCYQKNQW